MKTTNKRQGSLDALARLLANVSKEEIKSRALKHQEGDTNIVTFEDYLNGVQQHLTGVSKEEEFLFLMDCEPLGLLIDKEGLYFCPPPPINDEIIEKKDLANVARSFFLLYLQHD